MPILDPLTTRLADAWRHWRRSLEFDAIDPRLVSDAGLDRATYCDGPRRPTHPRLRQANAFT